MKETAVTNWIYKLKRLPNKRRGLASGLSNSICFLVPATVGMIAKMRGVEYPVIWLILGVVIAKACATMLFYSWAASAKKLEE